MFERIMVPLDGSSLAEAVLPLAGVIARASGAELVALRAVQTGPHIDVEREAEAQIKVVEEAEAYLGEIAQHAELTGLEVVVSVPYGPAAEMIVDQADARQVDLIVMATHGRTGIARWALGSVADRVLQAYRGSLLIVRPKPDAPPYSGSPERIVVPLDGSELAERALEMGVELAATIGADLCLVRVVAPSEGIQTFDGRFVMPDGSPSIESARAAAEDYLAAIGDRLTGKRVTVLRQARVGDVATEIEAAAKESPSSIVVMSTHGRSGVTRWIYGSIADRMIRQCDVPVLVQRSVEATRFFQRDAASLSH